MNGAFYVFWLVNSEVIQMSKVLLTSHSQRETKWLTFALVSEK